MLGPTWVSESKIRYPLRAIGCLFQSYFRGALSLLLRVVVPAVGVLLLPWRGPGAVDAVVAHERPAELEVQRLAIERHEVHLAGLVLQRLERNLLALRRVDLAAL